MDPDQTERLNGTTPQMSNTERAVAALWCEALQMPDLPSTTDNFFALGGDSMTMTLVEFRINEELSVELPQGALLGAQSLSELSALVDSLIPGAKLAASVVD
jgi:acyl carrier protein